MTTVYTTNPRSSTRTVSSGAGPFQIHADHSPPQKYLCFIALFASGERFPVLLHESTYQPVILVTRYVIDERRENKQSSTVARDVRVLRWFYEWCDKTKIRLEKRLRAGDMLTKAEVTSFCRYLRAFRRSNVSGSIELHSTAQRSGVMSPETFNSYIGVVQDFLLWAAYEFIPTATPEGSVRETLRFALDRLRRSFRSNLKAGKSIPNRCGLSREEVERVRSVIDPGATVNPFKKCVRFRNWLIFELMLATGIRRGELLKLKLQHLPVGSKTTLSIIRAPDDKADPRRHEPQVKTRIREIPLHQWLARMLWRYVQQYRPTRDKSQTYLFTSTRGGPMSSGAINWIFSFLVRTCVSDLNGELSPHTMRHTYNEQLVELAESLGYTQKQTEEMQRYLNGWSDISEMPTRYTRRIIEARAMAIAENYQNQLYAF
jgi:integrase